MDNSKVLYNQFATNNESALNRIKQLIDDKELEGYNLEFKKKANPLTPKLDDADRKSISTALSQFANSEGGVLIFGIDTDDSENHFDQATALIPIQDVDDFRRRLMDFIPSAVVPIVDLVESVSVLNPDGSGFVVVHIPSSSKSPHRATIMNQYYKRGQQGKYILQHIDLEDMFGRRQKPLLSLCVLVPSQTPRDVWEKITNDYYAPINFALGINNAGRALGKNVLVILSVDPAHAKLQIAPIGSTGINDSTHLNPGTLQIVQLMPSGVFHPELSMQIANLGLLVNSHYFNANTTLVVKWKVYAEGMQMQSGDLELKYKEAVLWQ